MVRSLKLVVYLLIAILFLPVFTRAQDRPKDSPAGQNEKKLENAVPNVITKSDDRKFVSHDTSLFNLSASMAVQRGLEYLANAQNVDGSLGRQYRVAETSIVGLAFLAAGNGQGRGPYAKTVRRCVDYLMNAQLESGYFSDNGYSRMHGQGFTILFMAQMYGMNSLSPSERMGKNTNYQSALKQSIDKAVKLCVATQTDLGGWNYEPKRSSTFDEASITICIVQGLRAARNAGIKVPKDTIDRAVAYIEKSYDDNGSFMYSLRQNIRRPSFALTAAGLSTLVASGQVLEEHKDMVAACLDYMLKFRPVPGKSYVEYYYYYAHLYAAQAMYHLSGEQWKIWYSAIRDDLLKKMMTSEWGDSAFWTSNIDTIYGTAMALLILQVPNGLLPIFQK